MDRTIEIELGSQLRVRVQREDIAARARVIRGIATATQPEDIKYTVTYRSLKPTWLYLRTPWLFRFLPAWLRRKSHTVLPIKLPITEEQFRSLDDVPDESHPSSSR